MKTKILFIGYDSNNLELIQDELKNGDFDHIAEIAQTETAFKIALPIFKPDIILSNYKSPTFDGKNAFTVKERWVPQTPFIFISDSIGEEIAVALVKNGATDFVLLKRLGTLPDKINRALKEVATINLKTKQKQSEEKKVHKLFQDEAKFRAFFENSMDGMLLTVTDGQILAANPAACKIFHMTEEEIMDVGRLGLVDTTDPRLTQLLEERQRTGRAKGELSLLRKDGSTFPGELASVMFKNANGEQRTSMIVRDITHLKETEQKLAQSADELQQALTDLTKILDSSLDIICSYDEDGRIVSINSASEHIWGYSPSELIGKKYIDFVFSEDAMKTLDTDTIIQGGIPVTMFENRFVHKDGHIVPMLWSGRWDEKDKINYAVGKDATEKKNLEKAFEIERQRFLDLYSQAPSSMGILKGPNHVFEMVNPLYLKLVSKSEEIIGKTAKEVLPEIEAQGIFELLDTVYKTGETFTANELLMKFDFYGTGELVDKYLNLIYQAHRGADGFIDGILFFVNDVTEQVVSRKKIEESEKKYRELIENLPVATYSCDAEGRIIIYNKAAAALWGREPEIGKDLWCGSWNIYSVGGNPIPLESCPMAAALREGKVLISEEIIIEHPNGERRNVIPYPVPFIDNEGRITGAVNVLTDITEIKKAQQTLKDKEKKYRYLFNNNPMPMWITELNTFKFLDVNKVAIEQYGYSREEFLSMTARDIRPEEDKFNIFFESDPQKFNRGTWNHQKKDGTVIQVEIIAHKIIFQGVPARFILSNDITDRRKAELDLEKRNKELADYKYALDQSSIVGITDCKGIITYANDNFCQISQYSREELIGQDHCIINSGYHSKEFIQKKWETISRGKTWKGELKNKAKDGTYYWVDTTITPFLDEHGKPYQFVATRFDITERKKAELNLAQQNKELVKTNSELDRFVYSVSHDLRSPLTSILGLLSFIEGESLEPATLVHADMIHKSINRLDQFIRNILHYSRNNRTGLEIEKISIQETAYSIVESLQSMKEAKEIHYEIDILEEQPFYSDTLRFNMVLENLVSNAIKHHKKNKSGRFIKITGQSDHENLKITVADNGIGIAPEHHQKIFDMFFRLSGETDGSGIGLYIVKDAVEKMQGTLEVQSEKELGTTFIITLKNLKP